jgi:hypothetical protein
MIANDPETVEASGRSRPKTGGNRAFCDRMNSWAQGEGQPGLGYIFWREGEEGGAGPLAKNIGPERTAAIAAQMGLASATPASSSPASRRSSTNSPGGAHPVGRELADRRPTASLLAWIVDFPMFEWNEEEKKVDFSHNPFSMPNRAVEEALESEDDPLASASRPSSTTSSATATRSPPAASATIKPDVDGEGLRDRRLWRRERAESSASAACTAPSSTARRRMAAWRPASTASSCCSAARRTCARWRCSR